MSNKFRVFGPVIATAVVVSALTVSAPAMARSAYDAFNAHKVDGKHAVSASATVTNRAGKLVATSVQGKLPNNIITKAPDADKLDGLDGTAYARTLHEGAAFSGARASGTLTGSQANAASLTFYAPANGYLMVTAQATFNGNQASSYVDAQILRDGSFVKRSWWDVGDTEGWYDQTQQTFMVIPVTQGTHTYTLRLSEHGSGTSYANYTDAQVGAMYFHHGSGASPAIAKTLANANANAYDR